jgi:hypothetical protein
VGDEGAISTRADNPISIHHDYKCIYEKLISKQEIESQALAEGLKVQEGNEACQGYYLQTSYHHKCIYKLPKAVDLCIHPAFPNQDYQSGKDTQPESDKECHRARPYRSPQGEETVTFVHGLRNDPNLCYNLILNRF